MPKLLQWLNRKIWRAGYAAGHAARKELEERIREDAHRYERDPVYRAACDRRLKYRSALYRQGVRNIRSHEAALAARGELEADRDRLVGPLKATGA